MTKETALEKSQQLKIEYLKGDWVEKLFLHLIFTLILESVMLVNFLKHTVKQCYKAKHNHINFSHIFMK